MLTQAEKDGMRADFEESLPDEATLYRKVYQDDGQGGQVETPESPIESGPFACRVSPLGATLSGWRMEQRLAERLAGQTGWMLTLPFGTDFAISDTASVLIVETLETKALEIVGVMDPRTYQVGTRLACVEIL